MISAAGIMFPSADGVRLRPGDRCEPPALVALDAMACGMPREALVPCTAPRESADPRQFALVSQAPG